MRYVIDIQLYQGLPRVPVGTKYVKVVRDMEEMYYGCGTTMYTTYTIAHANYGYGHLTTGHSSVLLAIM